jgi:hypothetical protein
MADFQYILFGVLEENVTFDDLVSAVKATFESTALTPSLGHLPDGKVLFEMSSRKPFEKEMSKKTFRLFVNKVNPYFIYSDLFESSVPDEKYFICFNTHFELPGRNEKNDQVMDAIWQSLFGLDAKVVTEFMAGYMTVTISWHSLLPENVRKMIKEAINKAYPDSIVFEHLSLP